MSTADNASARSATSAFAAIDIGSNSTNLLIVDSKGVEIVREVNVTALGEGVGKTGTLSQIAKRASCWRTRVAYREITAMVRSLSLIHI